MFKTFATALALSLAAVGAQAATIFTDDFNADTQGTPVGSLIKWDITDNSVDVIPSGGLYDFYPGNGNYIDLNGSTSPNTEGRIQTKGSLGLIVGKTYTLTFNYGVNPGQSSSPDAELTFGLGTNVTTLDISIPSAFLTAVYNFVYDGTGDYLSFADTSGTPNDQGGPVIDNVVLSAVPVPAGGLLLIGALGGLAALRRRKA